MPKPPKLLLPLRVSTKGRITVAANNGRRLLREQATTVYAVESVKGYEALAIHSELAEHPGYFDRAVRQPYKANRIVRPEGTFYVVNVSKVCWYDPEFTDRWVVVVGPDGEIAEMTEELTRQSTQAARYHSLSNIASVLPAAPDAKTFLRELYAATATIWEELE
jgi:hypothetical protein